MSVYACLKLGFNGILLFCTIIVVHLFVCIVCLIIVELI